MTTIPARRLPLPVRRPVNRPNPPDPLGEAWEAAVRRSGLRGG